MKNQPRPRRARPLLLASAALTASLASAGCPFGNLKLPNCDASPEICNEQPDLAVPDMNFGNLRAPIDMKDHD